MQPANPAWLEGAIELAPGQRLTLEPLRRGMPVAVHSSRIEEVADDILYVLPPMRRRQVVSVPLGTRVRVGVRVNSHYYGFETTVVEHQFHPQFLLGVTAPEMVERRDQREFYRLPSVIHPERSQVVDDHGESERPLHGTIVNLGGGGVELVTPEPVGTGKLLSLRFRLQGLKVETVAQTVDVEPPSNGRYNHRVHCQFLDLEQRARERIVQYVFAQQRDLLQRGLLGSVER